MVTNNWAILAMLNINTPVIPYRESKNYKTTLTREQHTKRAKKNKQQKLSRKRNKK